MTDIAKAIAFAEHCLKWDAAHAYEDSRGVVVHSSDDAVFYINDSSDLERVLTEFLGNRYFIQINRGTGSLFHWRVIVGLQDRSVKGAGLDNAHAEGEDLWDVIFDACVHAASLMQK
jgi:hypothetical protein